MAFLKNGKGEGEENEERKLVDLLAETAGGNGVHD